MSGLYDLGGLAASLSETLAALRTDQLGEQPGAGSAPPAELTISAHPEHGDVSTNAALVASGKGGRPREFAAELGRRWLAGPGAGVCRSYEVAGPGFLNLFLAPDWYRGALQSMLDAGEDYGRGVLAAAARQRVNIEFVSVNPTGPLHVGHARYAAMGDALCRIFAFAGHDVTREFYINDYGTQMLKFGQSLAARCAQRLGIEMPVAEDGYQGEYLLEIADRLLAEAGDRWHAALAAAAPDVAAVPRAVVDELKSRGCEAILVLFRATLERLRVPFDVWKSEATLYDGPGEHRGFRGEVGKALAEMDAEDELRESEGAVWLCTTRYGDDKDRVLIRQTGEPTYFLSDIAYHRDKLDRGFDHLIDIWGADHHGYVPRMRAAFTALPPHDPDKLELIIGQLVNLMESGAAKRMSKRRGDIVTVDDLVEAIGVDATRFFMVGRSHDSTLDIDLDLAVEQSNKNPVYYVQYAHARIASILRNLSDDSHSASATVLPAYEAEPAERALLLALARFPLVISDAVERRGPHRLHNYLGELAAEFHVFYKQCRVLDDDAAVAAFRVGLCRAAKAVLASGLRLLGVSAPEQM